MSEPQVVPLAWLPPSVQTGAPVAQTIVPLWQGLPLNEQAVPAAQATQTPLLQTLASPQTVPFAWGHCVSMQESPDVAQTVWPTWQGLLGVQPLPSVQAGASRPASIGWPPPVPPLPPPLPPLPNRPPAPPSGTKACSRKPHPRLRQPSSTVNSSVGRDIVSPRFKSEGRSRTPGS